MHLRTSGESISINLNLRFWAAMVSKWRGLIFWHWIVKIDGKILTGFRYPHCTPKYHLRPLNVAYFQQTRIMKFLNKKCVLGIHSGQKILFSELFCADAKINENPPFSKSFLAKNSKKTLIFLGLTVNLKDTTSRFSFSQISLTLRDDFTSNSDKFKCS